MSLRTPYLIDVAKTHPSKAEKMEVFKTQHSIETYHAKGLAREELPWTAFLMPRCREIGIGYGCKDDAGVIDLVGKVGRLLEESSSMVDGFTERDAIRRLCGANGIQARIP